MKHTICILTFIFCLTGYSCNRIKNKGAEIKDQAEQKVKDKSKNLADMFKPRTGEEIYLALFGKPQHGCLKVINQQDQIIPKIDYAIWLEFETCAEELKRILSLHNFTTEKQATKGWNTEGPLAHENWFKPEALGDTVWVYKWQKDEYGNGQTIYSKLDCTKAFCIDILD